MSSMEQVVASDDGFALFNCEIIDGEFWGEDYVFCIRARQAGFKVLVDPRIELNHAGARCSLQSVIESQKKESFDAT